MHRVLVVEDDDSMLQLIVEELTEQGYSAVGASDAGAAERHLEENAFDAVVTDLNLARSSGLSLCHRAIALDPDLPVILITAFGSMETAIEAMRAGVYDFITKPFRMSVLLLAVERAVGLRELKREVASLRVAARQAGRTSRLSGTSSKITRLRETIAAVAATDATILLQGESGSGKELVAREVHQLSKRAGQRFVAENVAAIPRDLVESALFGHVRGAFTGAAGAREGLFRSAHGGTLLLDEIGELPLELQPKLLRVLEEGEVRPVGSDRAEAVDVRLLAATHRDLEEAVAQGRFREDLYYRLAVIELAVPPLRERGGDVLLLAQIFLEEQAKALGKDLRGFHHHAAARLLGWQWPGNVRELRNAVQRAAILAKERLVMPSDLPARMQDAHRLPKREADEEVLLPMSEVERRHILRVLQAVEGNKAEAARVLGIGRKTLYRKLEGWGIDVGRKDTDPSD